MWCHQGNEIVNAAAICAAIADFPCLVKCCVAASLNARPVGWWAVFRITCYFFSKHISGSHAAFWPRDALPSEPGVALLHTMSHPQPTI